MTLFIFEIHLHISSNINGYELINSYIDNTTRKKNCARFLIMYVISKINNLRLISSNIYTAQFKIRKHITVIL